MLRKLITLALAGLMVTAALPTYASAQAASAHGPNASAAQSKVTTPDGTKIESSVATGNGNVTLKQKVTESSPVSSKKHDTNGPPKQKRDAKPVRRPPFHAFCPGGLPSQEELANRLAESINKDASGRTRVRGCLATPLQFLYAFQQSSRHDLTLADLPRYVREDLEETEIDHSVTWVSSCIRGKSAGPEDVKMDCRKEKVAPGVKVLRDKKTGLIAIKLDCANPGLVPATPHPCATVLVRVPDGSNGKLAVSEWGEFTPEEESLCPLSIQGPKAAPSFGMADYRALKDETGYPCSWNDVARLIKLPLHQTACVRVASGWYLVRGPFRLSTDIETRLVFCLVLDDGRTVKPLGALPETYRKQANGWYRATIWPSEEAVPKSFRPTFMWWHWMR